VLMTSEHPLSAVPPSRHLYPVLAPPRYGSCDFSATSPVMYGLDYAWASSGALRMPATPAMNARRLIIDVMRTVARC